jgi:hypothetical protein
MLWKVVGGWFLSFSSSHHGMDVNHPTSSIPSSNESRSESTRCSHATIIVFAGAAGDQVNEHQRTSAVIAFSHG